MPPESGDSAHFDRHLNQPRVITPAWQQVFYVRFLGPYHGLLTHYAKGGSAVCGGEECKSPLHRVEATWKAYAAVERWNPETQTWQPNVLEITNNLADYFAGRNLRGEVWSIERVGKSSKKTKVQGQYLETIAQVALSLPFDLLPIVKRFYGVSALPSWGAANPMPPKVILPDSEGAPPPGFIAPKREQPATPEEIQALREKREAAKRRLMESDRGYRT